MHGIHREQSICILSVAPRSLAIGDEAVRRRGAR